MIDARPLASLLVLPYPDQGTRPMTRAREQQITLGAPPSTTVWLVAFGGPFHVGRMR